MKLTNRLKAPLPVFFKKVRNTGLAVAAGGATLLIVSLTLTPLMSQVVEILTVAGVVAAIVSQATTGGRKKTIKTKTNGY